MVSSSSFLPSSVNLHFGLPDSETIFNWIKPAYMSSLTALRGEMSL